ncbi:tetratricopeptide repeat-containing sensor histidine kinase [Flavobacterium sp.]|uniref:tetratricopeptide repeat-containing sensor histidine kinase n=1 Tax=Flavobacterium sp. TaxID=239 RepID=UPI003D6BACD5
MKFKITFLIFLLPLLFPFSLFPQKKANSELLHTEIRKKGIQYKGEVNFYKAQSFFLKKNWDSTLVYSMKQLSLKDNKDEIQDFCHYFRAFSFKNKKLPIEARKEFNLVSDKFLFYYKVRLYLGEISLELNDYQNAIKYFEEIERLPEKEIYDFKKGAVYHNLGISYLLLNKFEKAEAYFSKGTELFKIEKDTTSLIGSYMNIANLYYEQYKDNLAIPYFEKAYLLSKKTKSFELKQNAAMNMAVVEENRKNLPLALQYRKEYETWKDSLNDQNKVWAIAELEKKFTVKQKQKEINILEAENKLKIAERNGFLYSSLFLLLLFMTGIYLYRQKIRSNKIILSQKIELDSLNATKDQLFSIVSHDLRSSVSALKMSNTKLLDHLESKNFDELDKLLHNNSAIANGTYNLLDNLLNWALLQTKQIYFQKESFHLFSIIQQIEYNYRPLMLDKDIKFENSVPSGIFVYADPGSLKIILRNLLDNAIKFSKEKDMISIYIRISEDDYCHLVVEDSGRGISKKMKEELLSDSALLSKKRDDEKIGTGLGMQLCKSLIKKNDGKLMIESEEEKGTKMIVQLQKTKKNE